MRRVFIAILCVFLLTTAVSAAGSVSNLQSNATIAADGTCQVSMIIQLTVESIEGDLRFPVPGNAKDISLNGNAARSSRSDGFRWVDLSRVVYGSGTYSLTIHYSLPDLVAQEEKGDLILTLPLLSGFSYPVNRMEFSITFPGTPEGIPSFSSTYHPESMDILMEYSTEGPVISGYVKEGLKDHETLTMTMPVSGSMFPQTMAKRWSLSDDDLVQYALTLLAAAYWLIFLRCKFPRRVRRVQAPDGITAGELGCCLAGQGVDFSMMVLTWAQMGYLTIQMDRHGRVLLHKAMDMGNERSDFEIRNFKTLFGKRQTVDGAGAHFAQMGRKVGKTIPGAWHYFKQSSGNPLIFRCIAAAIGAVAGYSLAAAYASDTVWQVILSIVLIPFGAVTSWLIQTGMHGIHLRHRFDLLVALGCSLVWLILGSFAGEMNVAVYVIASQILAGFAVIHGGRRTEAGLQARNEILGLRKYLKSLTQEEVRKILEHNPDYYFAMAPHAMALGVDKIFARQFGAEQLSACPYLVIDGKAPTSARQWNDRLRKVIQIMDDRQRKLMLQKILGK